MRLLKSLDRALALRTTIHLLVCLGGVAAVSFILSAHWLLILFALPVIAGTWYVLYLIEKGFDFHLARRASSQERIGLSDKRADLPRTAETRKLESDGQVSNRETGVKRTPTVRNQYPVAWPELLQ